MAKKVRGAESVKKVDLDRCSGMHCEKLTGSHCILLFHAARPFFERPEDASRSAPLSLPPHPKRPLCKAIWQSKDSPERPLLRGTVFLPARLAVSLGWVRFQLRAWRCALRPPFVDLPPFLQFWCRTDPPSLVRHWCGWSYQGAVMASRLAAVAQLPLPAVNTPLTSILLRTSDSDGIAQWLLSMDPGTLLACPFFASSEPATCCLTDPCAIDAMVLGGVRRGAFFTSTPARSACWLALISCGCRTCFEVDTAGVGGVVQALQAPSSPLWVAARFAAASDAYQWLAGQPAQTLLEVLACTVAACDLPVEPPRLRAPPEVRAIDKGAQGGRSTLAFSGTSADAAVKCPRLATASLSGSDARSARSSTSHGRARVLGSSDGCCKAGLSEAPASSSGFVRSSFGSSRCSTGFDVSTRLRSSPSSFTVGGVSSSGRRAADGGGGRLPGQGACDATAVRKAHTHPGSGVKRTRLCEEDGPSAAMNPAGVCGGNPLSSDDAIPPV